MTSSIIQNFHTYYTAGQQQQDNPSSYCTLQWRQRQLLVKTSGSVKQPYLASLDQPESLVNCLKHSPTSLVRIDPKLGGAWLRFWADACEQASKPIFLQIPSANQRKSSSLMRPLKRLFDWIAAFLILVASSPIILLLILLIRIYSPGTVFSREWHVGMRGKLFRAIKFRTTDIQVVGCDRTHAVLRWMRKSGLENLPQLLNVLRGEMSLIGPRCLRIEVAVVQSPEGQRQLNKLPGIMSLSVVEASNLLHLDSQTL